MENLKLSVQDALQKYAPHLPKKIIVGASGGKDSMLLCHLLKHLGYEVIPVIIDMGYTNFYAKLIFDELSSYGFNAQIVHARELIEDENLDTEIRTDLSAAFQELDDGSNKTPCTACSRNKRVSLKTFALRHDIRVVAYGHHLTDFNVTLLKDYYLYKYNNAVGIYDVDTFRQFIERIAVFLLLSLVKANILFIFFIFQFPLPCHLSLLKKSCKVIGYPWCIVLKEVLLNISTPSLTAR
jgi:hypothetical protein